MSKKRKYLLEIPHNSPILVGPLFLATSTWEHIQEGHPEVDFPDLYETICNPDVIHQDAKKENGVLFIGARVKLNSSNPLRVSVKRNLPDGNFVQTAFYSRDKPSGKILWSRETSENGGDDDSA